jgi:hypothetical protein
MRDMSQLHAHRPPPAALVSALVAAGLSLETALAMDALKAAEVLELLALASPRSDAALRRGRLSTAW